MLVVEKPWICGADWGLILIWFSFIPSVLVCLPWSFIKQVHCFSRIFHSSKCTFPSGKYMQIIREQARFLHRRTVQMSLYILYLWPIWRERYKGKKKLNCQILTCRKCKNAVDGLLLDRCSQKTPRTFLNFKAGAENNIKNLNNADDSEVSLMTHDRTPNLSQAMCCHFASQVTDFFFSRKRRPC